MSVKKWVMSDGNWVTEIEWWKNLTQTDFLCFIFQESEFLFLITWPFSSNTPFLQKKILLKSLYPKLFSYVVFFVLIQFF